MGGGRGWFGIGAHAAENDLPPPQPDEPIYAIGDIHGRIDLLDDMLSLIAHDVEINCILRPRLIFLGDFIDRGEDAAPVLRRLLALAGEARFKTSCLMGNHERMMLDFLADPAEGPIWLHNGGLQTLLSFGVRSSASLRPGKEELMELSRQLGDAIGPDVLEFLTHLALSHRSGNVFFCHAGPDPDRELDDQQTRDLLWRRAPAKEPPRRDGVWVVHGHTPVDAPAWQNGRLDIDTGAYFSGTLSAVRLFSGGAGFLST